jgi:glycerophosphoryl diester phosphodiesterase
MKRKILLTIFLFSLFVANGQQSPQQKLNGVFNAKNKTVLVTAHRGDWRNAPENSLQGLKNSIKKGFDVVECDLKRTKDGVLILMHDKTIDRSTNGKGKPEDYTLEQIKQFKLEDAIPHATAHTIPTLKEFLELAKNKVIVCLDKGFDYFDEAMKIVTELDMQDQIIYNIPAITLDSLKLLNLQYYNDSVVLNILGFPIDTANANKIAESYKSRGRSILHPTFNNDTIPFISWMHRVKSMKLGLWLNSLWPEHNGVHHDDRAVEQNDPDGSWGWLIKNGATIIQTDRPTELLKYLKRKKVHQ